VDFWAATPPGAQGFIPPATCAWWGPSGGARAHGAVSAPRVNVATTRPASTWTPWPTWAASSGRRRSHRGDGSLGCAKLVVFANAVEDNPSWRAPPRPGEPSADQRGRLRPAWCPRRGELRGRALRRGAETIKKTAFRSPAWGSSWRGGVRAARRALRHRGPEPGPTPAVGDSVADILERMGLVSVGAPAHGGAGALYDRGQKGRRSWPRPMWAGSPAPSFPCPRTRV
jgi:uncharacterized protein (UPF0210 family)